MNTTAAPADDNNESHSEHPHQGDSYPPVLSKLVDELVEMQTSLNMSDDQFARQYLDYSRNQWCKIRLKTYKLKDLGPLESALERNLRKAREINAARSKSTRQQWFEWDIMRAIRVTIANCMIREEPVRLIPVVGPTGAGKSVILDRVRIEYGAHVIQAKESWRTNYMSALLDILYGCGVTGKIFRCGDAEKLLIEYLKAKPRIIAIDEGNYFGSKTINLLKLILNESRTVVVMGSTPAHFNNMRRYWDDYDQLQRRIACIYRVDFVHPSEVQDFLTASGISLAIEPAKAAARIAKAANAFGLYGMVSRVMAVLIDAAQGGDLGPDEIDKAITIVRKQMGALD